MLDAFKVKPYNLEPVYASWSNPPIFQGKPNDDPLTWMAEIKAGCLERKVPKEHWHRVGRHFLGPMPRQRLEELGKVMQRMSGDKSTWNWKKFKVAMQNLGWGGNAVEHPPVSQRPTPKKQGSWWIIGSADSKETSSPSTEVVVAKSIPPSSPQSTPPLTPDTGALTTVSKAPVWLVNACTALDYLTSEHPKVMSAMSAILITVGTIPAIPAIGAGAGGAILASGAAQAVGALAVGVGQWLKAQHDGQLRVAQAAEAPA